MKRYMLFFTKYMYLLWLWYSISHIKIFIIKKAGDESSGKGLEKGGKEAIITHSRYFIKWIRSFS
jgi:hypothetical protein